MMIRKEHKTPIIKLNLCNYSDAYILVEGNITVAKTTATASDANSVNKKGNI